ncbi:MAG: gamma-glutamyltransferase [Phycisphaerales bacterium]|nr:MAG: gamma-glutamyltransferase [Phycisphaerales bacterium]
MSDLVRGRLWIVSLLTLTGGTPAMGDPPDWLRIGSEAMVASDSAYASQAGVSILRAGGNAIDAACAVSFALAVTRPESTGLGGGGFLIARFADGRVVVADFRETAPARASADMYVKAQARHPDGPPPSRIGYVAVAVPGLVRGRAELLQQFGSRSLATVLKPAIHLAKEGFAVDEHYVSACTHVARQYEEYPSLKESCGYVYRRHLRSGDLPQVGDRLVQPELGRLLEALAEQGADVFYTGDVADAIARTMVRRNGVIRRSDLAGYKVAYRKPIRTTYRGYEVVGMPPPSSGGVALAEALNILEEINVALLWRSDQAAVRHFMAEAMKHAFADRARWLGDSDYARVPVGLLTSKPYAGRLARTLRPRTTRAPETYGTTQIPDDAGTSHFCVVDRWGNCVVSTETINTSFGSLAAVDEWGLILNNEMDDFTTVPGEANAFGLRQSVNNAVAPGRRPLSSMTPTIVLETGRPILLIGASGGPRIISAVLNVTVGVTDLGMSLEEAIKGRRIHHQWSPDEVVFDAAPDPQIVADLQSRGHTISSEYGTGIVQTIALREGRLIGASDPRKGGRPDGY